MAMKGSLHLATMKCKQAADFSRTYSRAYTAAFDPADDEEYVRAHCGVPLFTAHPTAAGAYVTGLDITHEADLQTFINQDDAGNVLPDPANNTLCRLWTIALEFGPWNPLAYSPDGNPINLPVRKRIEFFAKMVPAFEDADGEPILNAAGDYFDPPVMRPRLCMTLTVLRNEASVDPIAALALSDKTNLAPWNGFDAGTVHSLPIRIPEAQYCQAIGALFYPMEYAFEVDEIGWKEHVLNQGFRQLMTVGGVTKQALILDYLGQPVSAPALLDADGHALLPPVAAGQIVVKEFKTLQDADFSGFNLDGLFA